MEYIENNGHVTRTYNVKIDVSKLEEIIDKLKNKCYRNIVKHVKVIANNSNEAVMKVNSLNDANVRVNRVINISNEYDDLRKITKSPYVFECEYLCKENSYLVYILQMLLKNYHSSLDFKKQNNRLIDLLIGYVGIDEMKSYRQRIFDCELRVLKARSNDIINLKKELSALILEMNNNINFDFNLLNKLYTDAKECFELELVSETVHYTDRNKSIKLYKLGTKRPL